MISENTQALLYALIVVFFFAKIIQWRSNPLNAIPTVGGPSFPILSFISAYAYFTRGKDLITEGYRRFYGSAFKIALIDQWMVILTGHELIQELGNRPDDELSFLEGTEDFLQMRHTLGKDCIDDAYHITIIKDKLVRALPAVLNEIVDELPSAVGDYIPTDGDEWTSVPAQSTLQHIIARVSNRAFIGYPLCRQKEFLDLAIEFTMDVVKDRTIVVLFPRFIRSFIGSLFSRAKKNVRRSAEHLNPYVIERRAKMAELGDAWDDRPNDMLQWLLEAAISRNSPDEVVAERVLLVNFASIHSSASSLTHVVYDLAAHPELTIPLREEIEPIIAAEGWTRAALGKMWKLDSLLRESQRFHGIGIASVTRLALKDIIFSDGTFVPKGTLVSGPTWAVHHDEALYPDAHVFDPFRFARLCEETPGERTKHQLVHTSAEFLAFGHGKHACPGRFVAALKLKAIMAYLILHYDIKIPGDGARPSDVYFGSNVLPHPSAKIMLRQRQSA